MFSRGNLLGSGGGADGYEVGAKRQRLIDPYFGGAGPGGGAGAGLSQAGLSAASLAYGASAANIAQVLGQPRPFPVVRLRGLPFNCSDSDVFEFFAGLDVVDVLLVRKLGRFSGEAFVVFGAPMQVDFALQRNRQNMGRRYIEVFRCKKHDYYQAVAADVAEAKDDGAVAAAVSTPLPSKGGGGGGGGGGGSSEKDHLEHTGVLKLRGLPFSASKRDIIDFFREYGLTDENVHIVSHSDGRATGEAFVEFATPSESKAAMSKDKMTLGSRYVELFPSSRDEATRAASKAR